MSFHEQTCTCLSESTLTQGLSTAKRTAGKDAAPKCWLPPPKGWGNPKVDKFYVFIGLTTCFSLRLEEGDSNTSGNASSFLPPFSAF